MYFAIVFSISYITLYFDSIYIIVVGIHFCCCRVNWSGVQLVGRGPAGGRGGYINMGGGPELY